MRSNFFLKVFVLALFSVHFTSLLAATVTIECNNGKLFTFKDLMDSPEVVGKEKCKDQDGYKGFTAQFSESGMMGTSMPSPQSKDKK